MDKWLQSNIFAKVLAVLLAILLWLVVSTEDITPPLNLTEHEYNDVTVTYTFDDTQFAVIAATDKVNVILTGNPMDIRSVFPGSLKVKADLTELEQGLHANVPLTIEGVPRGVSASIQPSTASVELARKSTIEMPVQIILQGTAAPGFTAGQPIVSPSRIFVTATEDTLAQIQVVSAYVNIDNVRSVIDETVRVRALDIEGNELKVEINPTVVDVIVPVSSPFLELPLNIHFEGYPAAGFAVSQVQMSTDQVTVFGPLDQIDRYEFFPGTVISLAGIRETTVFEQALPLIDGTTKVEPENVSVTVEVVPSETMHLEDVPITVNGAADNIAVDLNVESIALSLEAAPEKLENLQKGDVQVFIDVSNKPLGKQRIQLQVNTPRFVKAFDLEHTEVEVTLERLE